MNRSGASVACLVEQLGLEPRDILIVYDDVELPLGTLRLRGRGGAGGHRGMESVIEALRTSELARLRLGIGRPGAGEDLSRHVLSPFDPAELPVVAELVSRAVRAVELWCEEGLERAMNQVNRDPVEVD